LETHPSSVGQPRGGDSRASYMVFDIEEKYAEFHLVDYDVKGAY
jgi:diadenosine tetraphosphatase ApaH/serine/threonine PP2A family protein phosphatase